MRDNSVLKQRVLEYLDFKGVSMYEFYKTTGVSNGVLSQKTGLSEINILKFLSYYPDVSLRWFLTGEGSMIDKETELSVVKEKEATYKPIVVTVDKDGHNTITMFDVQAAAGLPLEINNPEYYANQPKFSLPGYQYQQGDFICIQVDGESMHPTIFHQDWLIAKRLYEPDRQIRDGYVHILATREGVVTKRLLNRIQERNQIVCTSDAEGYNTYSVNYEEEVIAVWRVTARLSYNLANLNADFRSQINDLRADLEDLRTLIKKT